MERSKVIFGNEIAEKDYKKAVRSKEKFLKKYGDDSGADYKFRAEDNPVIGEPLGVKNLVLTDGEPLVFPENALIVGNIRMGYGHYRISMAIASAAHALGYVPYWLDLNSYKETTATKIISGQNDLYSMGSRLSQKFGLFNKLVWEPLNSEGFRKLTYNSSDQKNAELMAPLLKSLPKDVPYVGTHVWPAQAAIHAGLTHVVNAIPDNWPMALHLSEGAIHTVQTNSSYIGYRMLRGMDPKRQLKQMPEGSLYEVGRYIDDEFVRNLQADNEARLTRAKNGAPRRFLLTIGGAGAQQELFEAILAHMLPLVKAKKAALLINCGDHRSALDNLLSKVAGLKETAVIHDNDYASLKDAILVGEGLEGVQMYLNEEIFSAVYITNLLLRQTDFVITKPSELAFYPVPKVMIHRVGGHEAWGAIASAELGDGTYEIDDTEETLAMLDYMTESDDLLRFMVEKINEANKAGAYNGAYEVVKLAAGKR